MLKVFFLLGFHAWISHAQPIFDSAVDSFVFTPLSALTENLVVDGFKSTQTIATVEVSNVLDKGTFYVDNFAVAIAATPPSWNYRYKEVGTVPKAILTKSFLMCSSSNLYAYQASLNAVRSASTTLDSFQSQIEIVEQQTEAITSAHRRLLSAEESSGVAYGGKQLYYADNRKSDFVHVPINLNVSSNYTSSQLNRLEYLNSGGCFITNLPLFQNRDGVGHTEEFNYLYDSNDERARQYCQQETVEVQSEMLAQQSAELAKLSAQIAALQSAPHSDNSADVEFLKESNHNLTETNKMFNKTLIDTLKSLRDVNNATSQNAKAILLMGEYAANKLNELQNNTQNEIQKLYDKENQANTELVQSIRGVALQIVDLTVALKQQAVSSETHLMDVNQAIEKVNSVLLLELTQTSLKRSTSLMYFNIMKSLPPSFIALVSDPGTPPLNNGVLVGPDTRLLLETFTVMYNFLSAVGKSNKIGTQTISWYLNMDDQLSAASPSISLRSLLSSIGPLQCKRPYYDTTQNWMDSDLTAHLESGPMCIGWIEIIDNSCTTSSNSFTWKQSSTSLLNSDICIKPSDQVTTRYVFTDMSKFINYMAQKTCNNGTDTLSADGTYRVYTNLTKLLFNVPQPVDSTICSLPIVEQLANAESVTRSTIVSYILGIAYVAFPSIFPVLAVAEEKKYGRLPSGLTYENLPFSYVAPTGNSTYNEGATPKSCNRVTFNIASLATVPVYAVYPDPVALVTKQITRQITQVNSSISLSYTKGIYIGQPVTFSENIILADDSSHLLPKSTLLVGSFSDPMYIYDIPDRLLDSTNNIYARSGTATYYLMPPGTTTTVPLSTFLQNNNNVYDATKAAVGVNLFAVPSARDSQGSQVCDVGGGLPTLDLLYGGDVSKARACQSSGYTTNRWINTTSDISSICPKLTGNTATYKMFNGLSDMSTRAANSASWITQSSGFAFHFLYEGLGDAEPFSLNLGSLYIQVSVQASLNRVRVLIANNNQDVFAIYSTRPIFDGEKHSILVIFTGVSGVDTVGLVVDTWLDQWSFISSQSLVYNLQSISNPFWSSINSFYGVQAVYGMKWNFGYFNDVFDSARIQQVSVCSYSVVENHCGPSTGSEQLTFASVQNSVTKLVICPGSTILFRNALLDSATKSGNDFSFTTKGDFSLSFWIHINSAWLTANGGASVLLYTITSTDKQSIVQFYISDSILYVQFSQGPNSITIQYKLYSVTNMLIPHKIAFTLSPTTYYLYVDTQLDSAGVYPFTFGGLSIGYTLSNMNTQASTSMIRYFSYKLTVYLLVADSSCDAETAELYTTPVGSCRTSGGNTESSMYCRSSSLCKGNCETFAVYNSALQTFANVDANQCDDGWLPPSCTTPCAHPDPITNVCLTNVQNTYNNIGSTGTLVPGGTWCDVRRNYILSPSPSVIPGTSEYSLTLTPRKYIMQVTIPIPSGQITSVFTSGVCPTIQAAGTGVTAIILLSNSASTTASVLIQWTVPSGCIASTTVSLVIAPYLVGSTSIPSCGNVTANIYILVGMPDGSLTEQLCRSLNVNDVAGLVESANGSQLSAVYSTIQLVSNTALERSLSISNGLLKMTLAFIQSTGGNLNAFQEIFNSASITYANASMDGAGLRDYKVPALLEHIDSTCDSKCQYIIQSVLNSSASVDARLTKLEYDLYHPNITLYVPTAPLKTSGGTTVSSTGATTLSSLVFGNAAGYFTFLGATLLTNFIFACVSYVAYFYISKQMISIPSANDTQESKPLVSAPAFTSIRITEGRAR